MKRDKYYTRYIGSKLLTKTVYNHLNKSIHSKELGPAVRA